VFGDVRQLKGEDGNIDLFFHYYSNEKTSVKKSTSVNLKGDS